MSWRWPIGEGDRLGGRPREEDPEVPLPIDVPFPKGTKFSGAQLADLQSACDMLADEIRRQITVRDNILAGQADLVFAYRPFCLPDSPEASGGVAKEMEIIRLKASVEGTRVRPALVIYHPEEDEKRRRVNMLEQEWQKFASRLNFNSSDHQEAVKTKIRNLIRELEAINGTDASEVKGLIHKILKDMDVTAKPIQDEGTMAEGDLRQSEKALDTAVEFIVSRPEILISNVERMANASDGLIEIIKEIQDPVALGRRIRTILEGDDRCETNN